MGTWALPLNRKCRWLLSALPQFDRDVFCPFDPFSRFGFSVLSFLKLWVTIMVSTQPFFMAGIEDTNVARGNAFGAFIMFILTLGLSLFGIWYDAESKQAAIEGGENGEAGYQLSTGDFPNYGSSH